MVSIFMTNIGSREDSNDAFRFKGAAGLAPVDARLLSLKKPIIFVKVPSALSEPVLI